MAAYQKPLEKCASVCRYSRRRIKQGRPQEGLGSTVALPREGGQDSQGSDCHRHQGGGAKPIVLHSSPREADEETGCAADEQEPAKPVDPAELGAKRGFLGGEIDAHWSHDEPQGAEGELCQLLAESPVDEPVENGLHTLR